MNLNAPAVNAFVNTVGLAVTAVGSIPTFFGQNPKNIDQALHYLTSRDARGFTPLHHAASSNNQELTKILVDIFRQVRAPVPTLDAPDRNGLTPLHWAIQRSGDVVVSLLVEAGANVNATDNEGRNCLHYALVSSVEGDKQPSYYEDLVRYLLERGANPNVPDAAGATSVHVASEFGLDSMLSILVELGGASVNSLDYEGENPLFYAVRENQVDIMAKLIDYGIDFSQTNDSLETVVQFCLSIGETKLAEYLTSLNAKTEENAKFYSNGELLASSSTILKLSEDFSAMWGSSSGHVTR